MGVGAKGKPRVVVAQHTGDCFDIHAVLECQGGEGMPLRYNKDKSENRCGATSFGFVFILFPLKNTSKAGVAGGGDKSRCYINDKFSDSLDKA